MMERICAKKKSPGHEGRAINGAERKLDTPF